MRLELIKNGILKGFMFDIDTASKFDTQSTGNGLRCERWATSRSYKAPPKTVCRNFVVEGNSKKVEDLISEVENGLLVYEVLGAHTSNPASGDFSVNSSSLFKIEKGEVAYPVKSAMLSGNLPECLKKVRGIGDDYKHKTGGLSPVGFYIPTYCLDGVTVTG
jgi:PmbA protein